MVAGYKNIQLRSFGIFIVSCESSSISKRCIFANFHVSTGLWIQVPHQYICETEA